MKITLPAGSVEDLGGNRVRVTLPGGSVTGLKEASGSLSSAQILALFSAPPVLVAGVVGKILFPVWATLVTHPGATPYLVAPQKLAFGAPNGSRILTIDDAATYFQTPNSLVATPTYKSEFFYAEDVVDQPMVLMTEVEDPTEGNGTLDYVVLYREITA